MNHMEIWDKEIFMEAPRLPHTATSPKAIYLSPCQLAATDAVQARRFRKTCVRPTVLSTFIGCTAFGIWMSLVQV